MHWILTALFPVVLYTVSQFSGTANNKQFTYQMPPLPTLHSGTPLTPAVATPRSSSLGSSRPQPVLYHIRERPLPRQLSIGVVSWQSEYVDVKREFSLGLQVCKCLVCRKCPVHRGVDTTSRLSTRDKKSFKFFFKLTALGIAQLHGRYPWLDKCAKFGDERLSGLDAGSGQIFHRSSQACVVHGRH